MTIVMLFLTKKVNTEKFLFYANVYSNIKRLVNISLTCVIMFFAEGKTNYPSTLMKLFALICFVIVSTFDIQEDKKITSIRSFGQRIYFNIYQKYLDNDCDIYFYYEI